MFIHYEYDSMLISTKEKKIWRYQTHFSITYTNSVIRIDFLNLKFHGSDNTEIMLNILKSRVRNLKGIVSASI